MTKDEIKECIICLEENIQDINEAIVLYKEVIKKYPDNTMQEILRHDENRIYFKKGQIDILKKFLEEELSNEK